MTKSNSAQASPSLDERDPTPDDSRATAVDDPIFASAASLIRAYIHRSISPIEVVVALLDRIDHLDPKIGAFVVVTREEALQAARRAERMYAEGATPRPPLLGVPITVKDQMPIAGVKMTQGSVLWANAPLSAADSPNVERVKAAGAVILGTTNVPEFGWKGDSGNTTQGPTRNPFNLARTAGGSSGGAAAALATGMGPLALGGDGAGSIRIPAAFCGVFGLKPSHGLVPWHPASALEHIVCEGPMARTVGDAAMLLDVIARPDSRDRLSQNARGIQYCAAADRSVTGLRAAWVPTLPYADIEPTVLDTATRAVDQLSSLGLDIVEVTPDWDDPLPILETFFLTALASLQLTGWGPNAPTGDGALELLSPGLRELVARGDQIHGAELAAAQTRRIAFYDTVRRFMDDYDVLLTPTLPVTAFPAGADHPATVCGRSSSPYGWVPYTFPFNLTGHPAASVPAGLAPDGLPVGLQVVGKWRDDATVLAVSAAIEREAPWIAHLVEAAERLEMRPGS